MDVTIYGNVFDIQLQSMAYLTVTILYRCLICTSLAIMLIIVYNILSLLLIIGCLGIAW